MALIIMIKVVPQSGKQGCKLDKGGSLKCYLKSAPEQGKANKELIKFLSQKLSVPSECVKILRGETSRNKSVQITSMDDLATFFACLGIEKQTKINEEN